MNSSRLEDVVRSFAGLRVLVVGDLVLDEYLIGQTTRISREAPVPIVDLEGEEYRPGGAANTAANLAAMGAKTSVMGVVGKDAMGEKLLAILQSIGINTKNVFKAGDRPTITKTRVMAGDVHTAKQQLIRIDRGKRSDLTPLRAINVGSRISKLAQKFDAIAFSDYGFGILSEPVLRALRKAAEHIPVIADSRFALMSLTGLTAVTPNEPETEQALNVKINGEDDVRKAGVGLIEKLGCQYALITRGNKGMALFGKDSRARFMPIAHDSEAVDVTGAGDTVVAAFTLGLAAGADAADAALISNHAASVAVSRSGAVAVAAEEIITSIAS